MITAFEYQFNKVFPDMVWFFSLHDATLALRYALPGVRTISKYLPPTVMLESDDAARGERLKFPLVSILPRPLRKMASLKVRNDFTIFIEVFRRWWHYFRIYWINIRKTIKRWLMMILKISAYLCNTTSRQLPCHAMAYWDVPRARMTFVIVIYYVTLRFQMTRFCFLPWLFKSKVLRV